jgi:SSS family solute:Na+ symporter
MFWKRTTGHGAFFGLLAGTLAAAFHHGMSLPQGASGWLKGGWFSAEPHWTYPSEMAQNFWTAIFAWTTCFAVTIVISLMTKPREDRELVGLVYSLTEKPREEGVAWYNRPATLGVIVLVMAVALNIIFW